MFFNAIKTHALRLITTAATAQKITTRPKVILGLSGGPDSLFLLHVLKSLRDQDNIELIAAHLDHGWRVESKDDVAFCTALCLEHKIPFVGAQAESLDISIKYNGSGEEVGRSLRRFFFQQTLASHNAHFIALGHHQDDQQETFLMRLVRGTTLAGLHGMNEIDDIYLRPLLGVSKKDIIQFLDTNKYAYLTDSTNQSDKYLRNRIRKYVIPALEQCDTRFAQNFSSTIATLKDEDAFLQRLTNATFHEIFSNDQDLKKSVGNLTKLQNLDPVLQRRVIVAWLISQQVAFTISSGFINEIMRFLSSPYGGVHTLGITWSLHKKKQWFWIEKIH